MRYMDDGGEMGFCSQENLGLVHNIHVRLYSAKEMQGQESVKAAGSDIQVALVEWDMWCKKVQVVDRCWVKV